MLVLSVFVAFFAPSCEVVHEGGQRGGYSDLRGHQNHQARPWGERSDYRQTYVSKETRGANIRVQGSAPSPVCLQVRDDLGQWCSRIHAENGVWPTFDEATKYAQKAFSKRGFNLRPTDNVGAPGGFKITEYITTTEVKGERYKDGELEFLGTKQVFEDDVPQSIRDRSRQGHFDENRRQDGDYQDHLLHPVPAPGQLGQR